MPVSASRPLDPWNVPEADDPPAAHPVPSSTSSSAARRRASLGALNELDDRSLQALERRWLNTLQGRGDAAPEPPPVPLMPLLQGLQIELRQMEDGLRRGAPAEVDALGDLAQVLCEDGVRAARAAHGRGPAREVLELMSPHLPTSEGGDQARDRALRLLSLLTRLLRQLGRLGELGTALAQNRFEHDVARWAANLTHATVHTGLIVALTTTLRQLLGFAIERGMADAAWPTSARHAVGLSCLLIGPALNVAGLIRDERQDRATSASRLARLAMLLLSTGALCAASVVGQPPVVASSMSSFGLQMLSYCLAREACQLFVPLSGNAPVRLPGTVVAAGSYGLSQTAFGMAMDAWAPRSGAGWAMAQAASIHTSMDAAGQWFAASSATGRGAGIGPMGGSEAASIAMAAQVRASLAQMTPYLPHDLLRAGLNAGAEVLDTLLLPIATHAIARRARAQQAERNRAAGRPPPPGIDPLRMSMRVRCPDRRALADQTLLGLAQRTSAFETIVASALAVGTGLQGSGLSDEQQSLIVNATVGALAAVIYLPFVYTYRREPPSSMPPWQRREGDAALRHRWPAGEMDRGSGGDDRDGLSRETPRSASRAASPRAGAGAARSAQSTFMGGRDLP